MFVDIINVFVVCN